MRKFVIAVVLLATSLGHANRESGGRFASTAVFVKFMSFGTGVDSNALQAMNELVDSAKQVGSVREIRQKLQQGREGEQTHCVNMVNANQRYNFIRAMAPMILDDVRASRGHVRTEVYVGFNCDDIEQASLQDLTKYLD